MTIEVKRHRRMVLVATRQTVQSLGQELGSASLVERISRDHPLCVGKVIFLGCDKLVRSLAQPCYLPEEIHRPSEREEERDLRRAPPVKSRRASWEKTKRRERM